MAGFEISGHLTHKMTKVDGQSQKGPWAKQEFVIQTLDANYPKSMCLTAWNDSIEKLRSFKKNDIIKVSFSAESRENKGRWYTELRAFKIELADEPAAPQPTAKAQGQRQPARQESEEAFHYSQQEGDDSLPF